MKKKRQANSTKKVLAEEKRIEQLEKKELQTLQNLKHEVESDNSSHPLTKITKADMARSVIGALIGTVGHFAFFYGIELADKISMLRATSLYLLSLVVCFFFMYYSGFRKVKEIKVFRFIPARMAVVYLISLLVVLITLFIFGFLDTTTTFEHIYKATAATLLLSVLGASTADILGKEKI